MFLIDFSAEIDIFGGKNPFSETLRYAPGSQKYFLSSIRRDLSDKKNRKSLGGTFQKFPPTVLCVSYIYIGYNLVKNST